VGSLFRSVALIAGVGTIIAFVLGALLLRELSKPSYNGAGGIVVSILMAIALFLGAISLLCFFLSLIFRR
jgi:hypothetical protein